MRIFVASVTVLFAACGGGDGVAFIPGSSQLPGCTDAPIVNLDGTEWFDTGTVTIRSAGCTDTVVDDAFASCPLNWDFSQNGNDVTIIVDDEYRIEGRLCGDQLVLRGGWWLPVEDAGSCTYDDDSAEEVGIETGTALTVTAQQIAGTLSVRGSCDADYDVTFLRVPVTAP